MLSPCLESETRPPPSLVVTLMHLRFVVPPLLKTSRRHKAAPTIAIYVNIIVDTTHLLVVFADLAAMASVRELALPWVWEVTTLTPDMQSSWHWLRTITSWSRSSRMFPRLISKLVSQLVDDLTAELAVTLAEAEEIVRLVASFEDCACELIYPLTAAGPSRPTQQQSSRASDLLSSAAETRFSTLSISLDTLIGHFSSIPPPHSTQRNMKGRDRSLVCAPITPGMVVELSGPPGGGKTCIALAIALSARLAGSSPPEVLLIGNAAKPSS